LQNPRHCLIEIWLHTYIKRISRGNKDSVPVVVIHNLCFVPLNPCLQHIFLEAGSDSKDGVVKGQGIKLYLCPPTYAWPPNSLIYCSLPWQLSNWNQLKVALKPWTLLQHMTLQYIQSGWKL
jgi:hypothetical protein